MMNKEEAEALMKEVQEDVPKGQTGVIEPEEMPKEGIIELEPDQLLRIELILTKRQKARLAEKLALFQLREAQQELRLMGFLAFSRSRWRGRTSWRTRWGEMAVSIRKRAISELIQADCLVTDVVGDVVRITADAIGGVFQVSKLDITAVPIELGVGVIVAKATATRCSVQIGGQVVGLYTGMTPGKMLFVGTDSRLTQSVPTRPTIGVKSNYHAAMALSSDTLLLNFQSPVRLVAA
jgi:hypothetical protein